MENEISNVNLKEVGETLAESLDKTQKNATDTEKLVQQVQALSGKELHDETVRTILADGKTPLVERIDLVHKENADYDQHEENNTGRVERLQDTQTENVGKATTWWGQNWGWVATVSVFVVLIFTPGGRRVLTTVTKRLAA